MLKHGDPGLASLAADRSMQAASASGDPVAIASSARIITHALMNGGHHATAVATAASYPRRSWTATSTDPTPGSLSVYGALLLRGAVAAAQDDNRPTAHELLAEAEDAARRLGQDANHCWTAFGPINAKLHRINIAVTLGDAGTAIDLARGIRLDADRPSPNGRRPCSSTPLAHSSSAPGTRTLTSPSGRPTRPRPRKSPAALRPPDLVRELAATGPAHRQARRPPSSPPPHRRRPVTNPHTRILTDHRLRGRPGLRPSPP